QGEATLGGTAGTEPVAAEHIGLRAHEQEAVSGLTTMAAGEPLHLAAPDALTDLQVGDVVVGHPLGIGGNVYGTRLLQRRAKRLLDVGIDRLDGGARAAGDGDTDVRTEPEARDRVHRRWSRTGVYRGGHRLAPLRRSV